MYINNKQYVHIINAYIIACTYYYMHTLLRVHNIMHTLLHVHIICYVYSAYVAHTQIHQKM